MDHQITCTCVNCRNTRSYPRDQAPPGWVITADRSYAWIDPRPLSHALPPASAPPPPPARPAPPTLPAAGLRRPSLAGIRAVVSEFRRTYGVRDEQPLHGEEMPLREVWVLSESESESEPGEGSDGEGVFHVEIDMPPALDRHLRAEAAQEEELRTEEIVDFEQIRREADARRRAQALQQDVALRRTIGLFHAHFRDTVHSNISSQHRAQHSRNYTDRFQEHILLADNHLVPEFCSILGLLRVRTIYQCMNRAHATFNEFALDSHRVRGYDGPPLYGFGGSAGDSNLSAMLQRMDQQEQRSDTIATIFNCPSEAARLAGARMYVDRTLSFLRAIEEMLYDADITTQERLEFASNVRGCLRNMLDAAHVVVQLVGMVFNVVYPPLDRL